MRVALDLSPLVRPFPVSVVRTVRPILDALRERRDVDVVAIEPPARGALSLWRQTGLPRDAARAGADALHSFVSAFPLTARLPVVQTVHEVPWARGVRENAGLVHRAWVRLGRARAAATCVPSQGVARDLAPHPRVAVVPWGVDPAFGPEPDATDGRLRSGHPELPAGPFVLALGATRPKKRLAHLCAGAARAGLPVVATGEPDAETRALAGRAPHLVLLGIVDESLLPALVRAAGCVAVLSTSEGFSLPVLESLRSRRPVVTAAGTVQSETAGATAFDVDPHDPDDVAAGLEAALGVSDERLDRGRTVADAADGWGRTAERLVAVWSGLA